MGSDRQSALSGKRVYGVGTRRRRGRTDPISACYVDYGLPTANQIVGFTMEMTDLDDVRSSNVTTTIGSIPTPFCSLMGNTRADAGQPACRKKPIPTLVCRGV